MIATLIAWKIEASVREAAWAKRRVPPAAAPLALTGPGAASQQDVPVCAAGRAGMLRASLALRRRMAGADVVHGMGFLSIPAARRGHGEPDGDDQHTRCSHRDSVAAAAGEV